MPIIAGNEPSPPRKKPERLSWGWLIPLVIVFGRPLIQMIRNLTAGRVTNQQLLIMAVGVAALVALVILVRFINRGRNASAGSLPTMYTPSISTPSLPNNQPFVPRPLRFEPIITGKVVLASVIVAIIMGAAGLLVFAL